MSRIDATIHIQYGRKHVVIEVEYKTAQAGVPPECFRVTKTVQPYFEKGAIGLLQEELRKKMPGIVFRENRYFQILES